MRKWFFTQRVVRQWRCLGSPGVVNQPDQVLEVFQQCSQAHECDLGMVLCRGRNGTQRPLQVLSNSAYFVIQTNTKYLFVFIDIHGHLINFSFCFSSASPFRYVIRTFKPLYVYQYLIPTCYQYSHPLVCSSQTSENKSKISKQNRQTKSYKKTNKTKSKAQPQNCFLLPGRFLALSSSL